MATDFFDRQDHARRQTTRLIVLFTLAVATIIVAIYLVVAIGTDSLESRQPHHQVQGHVERSTAHAEHGLWRPELFLGVAAGTLLVVALGRTNICGEWLPLKPPGIKPACTASSDICCFL